MGSMAKASQKQKAVSTRLDQDQKTRLWLMYPPKQITNPVIWQLGHKFKVTTNVRQASVTDEIGIVCLELDGERKEIKAAIKWLEGIGVSVEPVEINVIES
jgi:ABC-type methionine transport system ATPase subunit